MRIAANLLILASLSASVPAFAETGKPITGFGKNGQASVILDVIRQRFPDVKAASSAYSTMSWPHSSRSNRVISRRIMDHPARFAEVSGRRARRDGLDRGIVTLIPGIHLATDARDRRDRGCRAPDQRPQDSVKRASG